MYTRGYFFIIALLTVVIGGSIVPLDAVAHEVYVLSPPEIQHGLETPAFSPINVIVSNLTEFLFWAFVGVLLVAFVFTLSISRRFEQALAPWLMRLKKYAPATARVVLGFSFLTAAYYQAIFGPELSLALLFGEYAPLTTLILMLIGILFVCNWYTHFAGLAGLILFFIAAREHGWYMLTYTNYIGGLLVLSFLGTGPLGPLHDVMKRISAHIAPYRFLIMRVTFGISLLYASVFAKFLHNQLALQVASMPLPGFPYSLAYYLGFDPPLLVVGAGIVEILIALFFIFGIEIRFTSLFVEFWLLLSLLYFGEAVWPHLILIGIPIAFIFHGYDRYSVEGYFFKKEGREPVL